MEIRFWGVRGSVAVSGSQVAWIGGNTPCLEVSHEGHRLILDAGTGIRALGMTMMKEPRPAKWTMLFSHLHWDHLQGFPFFSPAYVPDNEATLYGPGPSGGVELMAALATQMQVPNFPVQLSAMRSRLSFSTAQAGSPMEIGPFLVKPFELPHPQGCLGYRIEAEGKSFVYATDVELSLDNLTPDVARHLEGADALCLDAQYTPDEYLGRGGSPKIGWGHSTMVDAAKVAAQVQPKRLYLFHHDPAHNDDMVQSMADEARAYFGDCEPAREGGVIRLPPRPRLHCA
jgi:phosphoribosyl 1,2-cyclic phosphodiesterase